MKVATGILAMLGCALAAQAQAPAISAVQGAADYSTSIAQGSVFIVKGTNLSAAGVVQAPGLPLQTSLSGVKITFTSTAGLATDAYMVYTFNQGGVNQLAAILPSTVAPGSYNVTATNGSTVSVPFKATVVPRHFGVITSDASGGGQAVIQNFISATQLDINGFTTGTVGGSTISPAKPGQVLTLYGTGLGPITTADNAAPGAIDFRSQVPVQVIVGGEAVAPVYAGRAPSLPGTDQINFTLPADVAQGCTVSLQVSVNGALSNPTTLAIAPPGGAACVSPSYSTDVLAKLDQGGTIVVGNFALLNFATTITTSGVSATAQAELANGSFTQIAGPQLANAATFFNATGGCQVFHRVGDQTSVIFGGSNVNLDAGDPITLNGPNVGNKSLARAADNSYSVALDVVFPGLPGGGTPVIVPGTYTIKGTGGKDVGPFTASTTISSPLKLSADLPTSVPRGQPLTLAWTGGASTDLVNIIGVSGSAITDNTANAIYDTGVFVCTTTAGKGSYSVPASVLSQLPGSINDSSALGILAVLSSAAPSSTNGLFTAPLTAGGSIASGGFVGTVGFLATNVIFQ